MEQYAHAGVPVSQVDVETRATFIGRTYSHLFGAILAFVGLEMAFFQTGLVQKYFEFLAGQRYGVMLVFGGLMLGSWIFSGVAHRAQSLALQYAALGAYVALYVVLFAPILYYADQVSPDGSILMGASLVTLLAFGGLTTIAFVTRKDFSFLGGLLRWGGMMILVLIAASFLMGFHLGTWFVVGMIAFAGAAILYDTSNVLRHYPEDRYVGAALGLFSSVMMLFFYILRLFLSFNRD